MFITTLNVLLTACCGANAQARQHTTQRRGVLDRAQSCCACTSSIQADNARTDNTVKMLSFRIYIYMRTKHVTLLSHWHARRQGSVCEHLRRAYSPRMASMLACAYSILNSAEAHGTPTACACRYLHACVCAGKPELCSYLCTDQQRVLLRVSGKRGRVARKFAPVYCRGCTRNARSLRPSKRGVDGGWDHAGHGT
eukprot:6178182-Pleurochrysis_carterae.AAC.3